MTNSKTAVIFAGFGGQGIVLAGYILGYAGVIAGLQVAQSASYGSEARGSACRSEVILSTTRITYPKVKQPDILGVMSQQGYILLASKVSAGGKIFYDKSLVNPDDKITIAHLGVPATDMALREIGRKIVANIIFLGAIVKHSAIVDTDFLQEAVSKVLPLKIRDMNIEALKIGCQLGAEINSY